MKVICLLLLFVALVAAQGPRCPPKDGRLALLLPDLRSCSSFFICSNGTPYRQNCPAGLHFNDKLKVCDWPNRAGCKRRPRSFEAETPEIQDEIDDFIVN